MQPLQIFATSLNFCPLSCNPYLWSQLLWPHVNDASDEGLNDAELGVDTNGDQHEEEDHRPDRAPWQLQHHLQDAYGGGVIDEAKKVVIKMTQKPQGR